MGVYLEAFEATAQAGKWPRNQWAIILRSSLSGAGLTAVASMPADQQQDYATVKSELLREYHISCETYRHRVFETPFSTSHPDAWLAKHRQSFHQWLAASPLNMEATLLRENTLSRFPRWLEYRMRTLNPPSYEDLTELIVRHMANQPRREQEEHQKTGRVPPSARPL